MEQTYNRSRALSPETKQKISKALANRPKSAEHRQHISNSLKNLWNTVPPKKDDDINGVSWDDVM